MQGKKKRGGKAALISMIVAAALVVILVLAGTLLRMDDREMDFFPAMSSFLKDTFRPAAIQ